MHTKDTKKTLKRDMTVNLKDNTIDIPGLGLVDINVIYDAYERIQQRKGIESGHEQGIHMGRPIKDVPDDFAYYYNLVKSKSISVVDAANKMGIGRATYYRYKEKYESYK